MRELYLTGCASGGFVYGDEEFLFIIIIIIIIIIISSNLQNYF